MGACSLGESRIADYVAECLSVASQGSVWTQEKHEDSRVQKTLCSAHLKRNGVTWVKLPLCLVLLEHFSGQYQYVENLPVRALIGTVPFGVISNDTCIDEAANIELLGPEM